MIPQHNWVNKLFGYQFFMEFKPERLNANVDALSHRTKEEVILHALSLPAFKFFDQFHHEATALPEIMSMRAEITEGTTDKGWTIINDVVLF
jgi:hypothetical protein